MLGGVAGQLFDEGQRDAQGQTERGLIVWGQGVQQFGQAVVLGLVQLSAQCPPGGGDVYQRGARVVRVDAPNDQAFAAW